MKVDPDATLIVGERRRVEGSRYETRYSVVKGAGLRRRTSICKTFLSHHHCSGGLGVRVEGSRL